MRDPSSAYGELHPHPGTNPAGFDHAAADGGAVDTGVGRFREERTARDSGEPGAGVENHEAIARVLGADGEYRTDVERLDHDAAFVFGFGREVVERAERMRFQIEGVEPCL